MIRFDYDSVMGRLKERVLRKLDGKNLILFSTNSAILEACAEEFDDLAMYDEFLTRESVWDTAHGASSIMRQAGFFAYSPHRKIGARGMVRISTSETFDGSHSSGIVVPAFTEVNGNGASFLTAEDSYLGAGCPYVDVPIVQGKKQALTVTIGQIEYPTGTEFAKVNVNSKKIENTLYIVRVNGVQWKEIGDIRLAVQMAEPSRAEVFSARTMPGFSGMILQFGDGSMGKQLQYGDVVEITYADTDGASGNVLGTGVIKKVQGKFIDDAGSEVQLYCSNLSMLVGGKDYESIDNIKAVAPRSFGVNDRAITTGDYRALILGAGYADEALVWGEKELNEDAGNPPGTYVAANENLVYITGYTIDDKTNTGVPITDSGKALIRKYLNDRKGATDILRFEETQIIYVNFRPTVYIKDNKYTGEMVSKLVHDALVANYSIKMAKYSKALYYSDYIAVIDGVDGVDHCECKIDFSILVQFTSAYTFDTALLAGVLPNTVSVMVRDTSAADSPWIEIAHDNGYGDFTGCLIDTDDASKGVFKVDGNRIDYATGIIENFVIGSGLSEPFTNYQVRVDFDIDCGGNLELPKRLQLFAYRSDETTALRMV